MNAPKPRNTNEIVRQALINDRASKIALALKEGKEYVAYHNGGNVWGVTKRSGSSAPDTTYMVDLSLPVPTCTCPDFAKHLDFCKHVWGLQARLEEDAQEAQLEMFDREMENAECQRGIDFHF